jgi:hypothetical protein
VVELFPFSNYYFDKVRRATSYLRGLLMFLSNNLFGVSNHVVLLVSFVDSQN